MHGSTGDDHRASCFCCMDDTGGWPLPGHMLLASSRGCHGASSSPSLSLHGTPGGPSPRREPGRSYKERKGCTLRKATGIRAPPQRKG